MQGVINFFRGSVRIEVTGSYPERFINVCAQNDIAFWDLERISENEIRVTMHTGSYKRLKPLAAQALCAIKPTGRMGVPFFLWRLRKRYALLGGMVICIMAVWVLSMFVWEIEVTGNDRVSAIEILSALDEIGVGVGSFGPSIDPEIVRNKILYALKDISWMTVNVNGSHAEVIVRERIKVPEIVDEETATKVIALKTGIIEKINVYEGKSQVLVGATVLQGEEIVSGAVESRSGGIRFVHAMADVYAKTWYEISAQMTLSMTEKEYTGNAKTKNSVIIGEKRINFYLNSGISISTYDKIIDEKTLTLPGGVTLPISFVTETYSEYKPVYSEMDIEAAREILRQGLISQLEDKIDGGEIVKAEFNETMENGVLTLTLKAECIEQIAGIIPLAEDEMLIPEPEDEIKQPDE